jgi:hypothetical protein
MGIIHNDLEVSRFKVFYTHTIIITNLNLPTFGFIRNGSIKSAPGGSSAADPLPDPHPAHGHHRQRLPQPGGRGREVPGHRQAFQVTEVRRSERGGQNQQQMLRF